jgi:circadian clock protein KaiB
VGAKKRSHKTWRFVLYITGDAAGSVSTTNSLRQICDSHLGDDYAIEVIDLLEHPELARQHQILATPTVIRTFPLPERRVIGDLSIPELVVTFLDLPAQHDQTLGPRGGPISPE